MVTQTFPGTRTLPAEIKGWAKPSPQNAIWKLGHCRWAIGCHKILERLVNTPAPSDAEATWIDHDQIQYCIRPRPADMRPDFKASAVQPGLFGEDDWSTMASSWVGIYRIGRGVFLKAKWLGWGGKPGEPAAMQLIRREAPQVPVPRVMHHWEDEDWNCYFTIMSEIIGVNLYHTWCDLEGEHRKRIAREVAQHLKAVGAITSKYATYADGSPLNGESAFVEGDETLDDMDVKLTRGPGPFTAEELLERLRNLFLREGQSLPASWGDTLHLCHMDLRLEHFYISDGRPDPPMDKRGITKWPLERQPDLRVVGIIDWERAAFYPHTMVTSQFMGRVNLAGDVAWEEAGWPREKYTDFKIAVVREMIAIGCPHPRDSPLKNFFKPEVWVTEL